MQTTVQPLPIEVIHLIAAGEVIDSLAAVVRELAENALDAGATRIVISLVPDRWQVSVTDNGCGISFENLQQVAIAHTTSKIHDRQDLLNIQSLGFRGEALHSLAQLADLTILSNGADGEPGWQIRYDVEGQPAASQVVAMATGTTVMVENLFGRWAQRRDRLPHVSQQLRAIQMLIQEMALAHPQVTWRLQVQASDKPLLQISPGKTARQILPQLLRDLQVGDLIEISQTLPEGELDVLLGQPDRAHRHRPDWIKIAVNGRFVRLPELEQAVIQTMRRMVPRDRFPISILHFRVPPTAVDWNRHPAKAELYLQHIEEYKRSIAEAIQTALQLTPAVIESESQNPRAQAVIKAAEQSAGYDFKREIAAIDSPQPLLPLTAIAQVHNMYILAEHPAGMWLVEQHIAHERVLYEQIRDRWELVNLDAPLLLDYLNPAQVEQLERIGLEIAPFGENVWAVRSLPQLLINHPECAAAVRELSLGGDLQTAQVAIACRTAIRNGTVLAIAEMQNLLNQWQRTQNPHTCPHGRPIYLSLEESSLSRFFRRHWVIGKSHGI
jgi:DNA mismatch repair protein MutL